MTPAVSRSARVGSALAGLAGVVALAGCSPSGQGAASAEYADGTYTAAGSYSTPETVETITVTLTLKDQVVTAVQVEGQPQRPESQQFQDRFIGGISQLVVGKPLDQIAVSRVAGSSLTSEGFTQALAEIKVEAAR